MDQIKPFQKGIVKSRYPWFIWPIFGMGLVLCIFNTFFLTDTAKSFPEKMGFLGTGIFAFVVVLIVVWRLGWQIRIDRDVATIRFRNVLSRKEQVFGLDEFDGYVAVFVNTKQGKVRVLYLVKKGCFCKKISGGLYANLQELEGALAPLPFLGERKLGLRERIRILRKQPVF